MMKIPDFKEDINEILKKINIKLLAKELQVPHIEVINHLNQLIKTIIKEISTGIFVIPYTGKLLLQSFIQEYNTKILKLWVRGKQGKNPDSDSVQKLIQDILSTIKFTDQLAIELNVSQVLNLERYIVPVLRSELFIYYQKHNIQVGENLFLVTLEQKQALDNFFSRFNLELAFKFIKKMDQSQIPDDLFVSLTEEDQKLDHKIKTKKEEKTLPQNILKFMKKVKLRLLPDNHRKKFLELAHRKLILKRREEEGYFFYHNNFQAFKIICKLESRKFERGQFLRYIDEKQIELKLDFDSEQFEKLFLPPAETEGQMELQSSLLKQIEYTRINTREFKQYFHKYLCLILFPLIETKETSWVYQRRVETQNLYQKFKKPDENQVSHSLKYLKEFVHPLYRWYDILIQMLIKFKEGMIRNQGEDNLSESEVQDKRKNELSTRITIQRILGSLILIETDFLIGIQQEFEQTFLCQNQ